ncbi:MAG TPA: 4-hydroxy-3-methylbut-2-enyl diphosphate reductase [Acidimicrobiales bacterium]|nr:4-hydroxy-3-methylbut-2-enyl diphosphate reductase [Acidimicrobiales bacterium]
MADLQVLAPLRIESFAYGGADTVIGAGRNRARRSGSKLAARLDVRTAVALVGVAGALDPRLVPGDLVIASELRSTESTTSRNLPGAALLSAEFKRCRIDVHTGPVVTSSSFVTAGRRSDLFDSGALAVDMESSWVMDYLPNNPLAVVRAISDTATRGPLRGGLRALSSLSAARGPLDRWARACGEREVILASPRSFCAGVERAIETVERAIGRFGAPVYVRRQIVHNLHVVRDLERKGAIFVEEISEVPDGAVVVLAAHGVSPEVRRQADGRSSLTVIDATCPLVAKVHTEVRRYASRDFNLVLIGHAEHEEVEGTYGEAPDRIRIVESVEDVAALNFHDDEPVAYLTQTTLAIDETAEIVGALRARYPGIDAPSASDICYATQNRQDAVRSIAHRCDLMIVVGSANSSNTARLVEVAQREGCRAELIEDQSQLQLGWLVGVRSIGVTAGASVPDQLVRDVVDAISSLGPVRLSEEIVAQETVHFALPTRVR